MSSPTIITDAPAAALIGGGFIGPVHVEALRRIGVSVAGVLGSSPERALRTAQGLAIGRIYRDLDDLLSDPHVSVVHVASPNQHHFTQVKGVLESGRHVICEKPLANSSQETRALLALAGARPAQAAAVNYNVRYYPLCREIRERIKRGDLGRLLSITGSYVQDWLLYPEDYNWRVEPGGPANLRAVADIGTHWMDLAQYVSGKPIRAVCADLATFHPRRFRPLGPSETFTSSTGHVQSGARRGRYQNRRLRRRPAAVRRGRAWVVSRLAGHRGAKEPLDDRDCRKRRVCGLGQRIAQPALARFA